MERVKYAIPENGKILKGAVLYDEPIDAGVPVLLKSYEAERIGENTILLVDKEEEQFLGSTISKSGQIEHYFSVRGRNSVLRKGMLVPVDPSWIEKGVRTNRGIVVEVGEDIAIVQSGTAIKPFLKSSLAPEDAPAELIEKSFQAWQFGESLRKHMSTGTPISPKVSGVKWSLGTSGKEGQEVETRTFGNGDTRILKRTAGGMLRWFNSDPEQVAAQNKKTAPEEHAPTPKTAEFVVGQNIPYRGETVEVVAHSANVVAYRDANGKVGTFYTHKYADEDHKPRAERSGDKDYVGVSDRHTKARQEQELLQNRPSSKSDWQNRLEEERKLADKTLATPEYQAFVKAHEEGWKDNGVPKTSSHHWDGWTEHGMYEFERSVEVPDLGRITVKHTWNPAKKDFFLTLNDRPVDVTYEGKRYAVKDVEGERLERLTLQDRESGNTISVDRFDLDKYRGTIRLDANGEAYLEQGQSTIGKFTPGKGITQADLFKPGTLRIIGEEVWKQSAPESGAVFENVLIGQVDRGIIVYRNGDEAGILDGDYHSNVAYRANIRAALADLTEDEERVKKVVSRTRKRLRADAPRQQDVAIAKARIETPDTEREAAPSRLDRSEYSDAVAQYFAHGGSDLDAQIMDSAGKPEWNATVQNMAEHFRAFDAQRAREIESFNALSQSGVLKQIPQIRPMNEYADLADETLRDKRRELVRAALRGKIEARRAGESKARFDWDESSVLPTNAKAVSPKLMATRDSKGNTYYTQYAIVPMDSVVQSHTMEGVEDANHPSELQARKRNDAHSVAQMRKIAASINDDVVSDNADATRGAPVVYGAGDKSFVVQGNGRTAGIKGTADEQRKAYHGMLIQKARALGIDPKDVSDTDMLVRVMAPRHTYEDARRLASFGQESGALPLSEVESARAYQNAQREPLDFNVNLDGLGNRHVDENNVVTFIKKNPELYKRIIADSGYAREAIESHPSVQSRLINTAMLAQLRSGFIEEVASRDDSTHLLVKKLAPTLITNQKNVAEGKVPEQGDLQSYLHDVIKRYDSLDSSTKSLMTLKKGAVEFLNDDPHSLNGNTLLHRMRQEDLIADTSKGENIFRDPLKVIGLVAYQQAVKPATDEASKQKAITQFAVKLKRFGDAMLSLDSEGEDMFGAMKSEQEQKRDRLDRIIGIAEKVLLENKKYSAQEELLSADESEASSEQYASFDVYRKMKKIAQMYGFALSTDAPIQKGWFASFIDVMKAIPRRPGMYREGGKYVLGFDKRGQRHWFLKTSTEHDLFSQHHRTDKEAIVRHAKSLQGEGEAVAKSHWNEKGGQKPEHKYIDRYRGKHGNWIYRYQDETGNTKETDEHGADIPDNHKWLPGDEVEHGRGKGTIVSVADTLAAIRTEDGEERSVPVHQLESTSSQQFNLRDKTERSAAYTRALIDKLEYDLEHGNLYDTYKYGKDEEEVRAKLESAYAELDKRSAEEAERHEVSEEAIFAAKPRLPEMARSENGSVYFVEVSLRKVGSMPSPIGTIRSFEDVAQLCRGLKHSAVEKTFTVSVDDSGKILSVHNVTIGAHDEAQVAVHESLTDPVLLGAKAFYVVHNHPSQNATNSDADVKGTRIIDSAAALAGVEFKGHVIVAGRRYSVIHPGQDPDVEVGFDMPDTPDPAGSKANVPIYEHVKYESKDRPMKQIRTSDDFLSVVSKRISGNGYFAVMVDPAMQVNAIARIQQDVSAPLQAQGIREMYRASIRANCSRIVFIAQGIKRADAESVVRQLDKHFNAMSRAGMELINAFVGVSEQKR